MSKTDHGRPEYVNYFSKEGPFAKRLTRRLERLRGKRLVQKGVTYHVMNPAEEYEYQRAVREAYAFNRPLPDRSQFIRSEEYDLAGSRQIKPTQGWITH